MRSVALSGLVIAMLSGTAHPRARPTVDDDDPQVDASGTKAGHRARRRRKLGPGLALLALAACGGSSTTPPPTIDAPAMIDAGCPLTCNAITGMGCGTTEKCAWLVDSTAMLHGSIGCSFAGGVAQGLPCTRDSGGGDNCMKGLTCYQDKCRAICGLGGTAPVCDTGLTCRSTEYLIPCGQTAPAAGLCMP